MEMLITSGAMLALGGISAKGKRTMKQADSLHIVFASIVVLGAFILMAMHSVEASSMTSIIALVVGHVFGRYTKGNDNNVK